MWSSISYKRKMAPAASRWRTAPASFFSRNQVELLHRLLKVVSSAFADAYRDESGGSLTLTKTTSSRSRSPSAQSEDEFAGTRNR